MHKENYSLEVLVNGRPVQEYYKNDKSFIEGREKTEYTLKFRNNSWKRVLAIFSVDGIEVIKGKAAAESENGYVIDAFASIEVKGYRIDEANVAAFKFANTQQSYSNEVGAATVNKKTGEVEYKKDTKNNGIIGVRVFEEKVKDFDYKEQYKKSDINYPSRIIYSSVGTFVGPSPSTGAYFNTCVMSGGYTGPQGPIGRSFTQNRVDINQMGQLSSMPQSIIEPPDDPVASAAYSCSVSSTEASASFRSLVSTDLSSETTVDFNLGTTWGEKIEDKVKQVSFTKSEKFADLEIYYASRESLVNYGIDFSRTKQYFAWPSAFEDKKEFCKVPQNYKV